MYNISLSHELEHILAELKKFATSSVLPFDCEDPPPTSRLHEAKQLGVVDENKDWKNNFPDINNFQFVISTYCKFLRTIRAKSNKSEMFNDLYVFDEVGNKSAWRKNKYVGNQKPKKIFYDPFNRYFSDSQLKFFLNIDAEDSIFFANYLISLSKDMRTIDNEERKDDALKTPIKQLSRIFCLGEQGIGKTTYLNYFFSTQSKIFHEEDVLWFRLDFNFKRFRRDTLNNTLLNQFVIVLHKYYLRGKQTPIKIDWEDMTQFMKKSGVDQEVEILKNINLKKSPLSQLTEKFIFKLIEYVRWKGFSFIFVIDGIDSLSLEEQDESSFEKLSDNLSETFFNHNYIEAVFILSLRDISYNRIKKEFIQKLEEHQYMQFFLRPKNLKLIIENKFNIARKALTKILNRLKQKNPNDIRVNLIDNDFLNLFEEEIMKTIFLGLGIPQRKNHYYTLHRMCGNNLRIMFRCIENVIKYFGWVVIDHIYRYGTGPMFRSRLTTKLGKKKYYVLRAYMMGGDLRKDYLSTYKYKIANNKITYDLQNNGRALIPNLFTFIEKGSLGGPLSYKKNRLLLRLRTIEYVRFCEKKINLTDLIKFFTEVYKFNIHFVIAELEELLYDRIIVPDEWSVAYRPDMRQKIVKEIKIEEDYDLLIKLTCLGEYIFTNLIRTFTYISFIVNDTPVPKTILSKMFATNYFWFGVSLNEAVLKQTINVLILIEYLKIVETWESKIFESIPENNPYSQFIKIRMNISNTIEGPISKEIKKLIQERLKNSPILFKQTLKQILPNLNFSELKLGG